MDSLGYQVARLTLAPDDVLVVKVQAALSDEQIKSVQKIARGHVGENAHVMVLGCNTDIAVLAKP